MKRRTHPASFREELQRTFLRYALVPIALAVVVVLCILGYVLMTNVIRGSRRDASAVAARIEETLGACEAEALSIAGQFDLAAFTQSAGAQADALYGVYAFLNSHQARMTFYLLDAQGEMVFTTERSEQLRDACLAEIRMRMIRSMQRDGEQAASMIVRSVRQEDSGSYWLTGRALPAAAGDGAGGYICFALPGEAFEATIGDIGSYILVTDPLGYVFTSEHPDYAAPLGKLDKEVRARAGLTRYAGALYYQTLVTDGRYVVYAVRECGSFLWSLLMLTAFSASVFLITGVAAAVSANRIAAQKTKLIEEITDACRQAQAGNLMTRLEISSHDEFEVIGEAYNGMLDSIRELMARSVELAEENAVARVRQLEAQFHPHFLYNTLENVRFLIRFDPKAAEEMTVDLSRLLRYSVAPDAQVTLGEDMDYTRRYMRLLKMRFEDRLRFTVELPKELEDAMILRLICQPLIENAVKYGIDGTDALCIDVRASREGGDLLIAVRDNGRGISPEMLAGLRERLGRREGGAWGHIGILNVHERIRLTYGERYGVTLDSSGAGTTATLRFPCRTREG